MSTHFSRRQFLTTSAIAGAGVLATPYFFSTAAAAEGEKLGLGAIGLGGQGTGDMRKALAHSHLVAACDVDRKNAEKARAVAKADKAEIFSDYRKLLDRKDVQVVTIGTPDHWHTRICIDALRAGKDVYCEKPLTLTIDEGKQLVKVVKETGRVLQVGTQQRGDQSHLFGRAAATVRSGGIGKLQKVTVSLPRSTLVGGPFQSQPVPEHLDWDMWLGQAPKVDYAKERCHYTFRWWYEYSGGIVTDWGAHHMDAAHWAMNIEDSGPLTIDGSKTEMPKIENGYNTPPNPTIDYTYPNDVQLQIVIGNEGVTFEGDKGKIYVNRGRITGKAIEEQDADSKLKEAINAEIDKLFKGNVKGHMANFFESIKTKGEKPPISDVVSQHRSVSACHLGNISCRLGRKLTWDAKKEEFVGDDQANKMLKREQREPYGIPS